MDPQLQQRLMLFAGFIPGGIAFAALLVSWYLHALRASRTDLDEAEDPQDDPRPISPGPRWLLPILLALGVAGADYAINDSFAIWPDSNNDRFTHAAVFLALGATIEGLVRLPLLLGALIRFIVYAGVFWMLSEGYTDTILGGSANLIAYTLFAALASTLIATGIEQNARHNNHPRGLGWLDCASWILALGAVMPVFKENQFALGSMYAAGLISVLGATLIVALIFRSLSIARSGPTFIVGFFLMLLTGSIVQSGTLNLPSVLLVASLPLVMLIPLRSHSGLRRLLTRVVLIAMVAGAASLTIFAPRLSFWPGAEPDANTQDDQSLEDYYNNLDE